MSRRGLKSSRPGLLAALAALAAAGCGGDSEDGRRLAPESANSPRSTDSPRSARRADAAEPFIENFEHLTGVRLTPVGGDLFGTRLEVPARPNRFVRFGAYSILWTRDDRKRELLLGPGEPDDDGIHWKRTGTSYSAAKPFGKRLVLKWVGRRAKKTTPQWERLERAVQAAAEGSLDPLPPEERPCGDEDLDPLRGPTGACSLRGIPVTFVEADDTLSGPALEARVLGFGYAREIRDPGAAPLRPKGRFLLVAYRVTNKSAHPIGYLNPTLRIGQTSIPESPDAAAMLPRSREFPLPPGGTLEARAAFDVDGTVDPRSAAFVLPPEREGSAEPSPLLAQGWIRLAKADARLPRPPGGKPGAAAAGVVGRG